MSTPRDEARFSPTAHTFYQQYPSEEHQQRTNVHYDQPAAFMLRVTGGAWNIYSSCLWSDETPTLTVAQEAKLDLVARLMALKPGMRILDVGCGWGGPLVYLCQTYGVRGVGLTLSPQQHETAQARAARHGVDARFVVSHWRDYTDDEPFDAQYSEEVLTHVADLGGFFRKVHGLLGDGGRMVNRELHLVHPRYGATLSRAQKLINEAVGSTFSYRTLAEELALVNEAGFGVQHIHSLPVSAYQPTLQAWRDHLRDQREEMVALVGETIYRAFCTYVRVCQRIAATPTSTIDAVVADKLPPD